MNAAHRSRRKVVKVRRSGRHTSPSQTGQVAGKAVQAAPAVAVTAGALIAVPHGHAPARPAAAARHGVRHPHRTRRRSSQYVCGEGR